MTPYTTQANTRIPTRIRTGSKRSSYPLDTLIPGTGFTVPASESGLFQHCRVAVSNYNRQNGTYIKCNKQNDGSLYVWRDERPKPEPLAPKLTSESVNPSKLEFCAYINAMSTGTAIFVPVEYQSRYDEFNQWTAEL